MNESTTKILTSILNERVGAHWNAWPAQVYDKKKKIDLEWLEWKYDERKNPAVAIVGSTDKEWKMIKDLIDAIKKEDAKKMKKLITGLLKTSLSDQVGYHMIPWSWEISGAKY